MRTLVRCAVARVFGVAGINKRGQCGVEVVWAAGLFRGTHTLKTGGTMGPL